MPALQTGSAFGRREQIQFAEESAMKRVGQSRRDFLKAAGWAARGSLVTSRFGFARVEDVDWSDSFSAEQSSDATDYTLHIKASPVEIAPKKIISTTTYNGQFPGPLLRFKEGRAVTVDVFNDTDTPEQLHWHGQKVSTEVDGASEEGTPFIAAHGQRRLAFTPGPSGLRFYHTHNRAGANLAAGQYGGEVGLV
jgi:FtsP/CotA-like multicopper oxidase with cupredoxin domain